jgi:hypothetical protein
MRPQSSVEQAMAALRHELRRAARLMKATARRGGQIAISRPTNTVVKANVGSSGASTVATAHQSTYVRQTPR